MRVSAMHKRTNQSDCTLNKKVRGAAGAGAGAGTGADAATNVTADAATDAATNADLTVNTQSSSTDTETMNFHVTETLFSYTAVFDKLQLQLQYSTWD